MAIMTKRGNLDNIVTYEHICDTYEDLQNIDSKYATLGSTAIVINQEEGLNAYMATSAGEWVAIGTASSGGGGGGEGGGGITPTGTYNITANGTYNVTQYATAKVNVPTEGIIPTGIYPITNNGQYDISTYAGVNVNVSSPEIVPALNENKILIPTTTQQNISAESEGFDGYKNVIIAKKDVDLTTHTIIQPNESTQYAFGEDLIFIPAGTIQENDPAYPTQYILLSLNNTLPEISYYYLRSGAVHISLASQECDIQFTPEYVFANKKINFTCSSTTVPQFLAITLQNQAFEFFTTGDSTYNRILTITVTEPIILEKVCNLNSLYRISIHDGLPNLRSGYQLDTAQLTLTNNNLYAIYAQTGQSRANELIIFVPFMWDSTNGFIGKYNNSSDKEIQIGLSSDYILTLNSSDLGDTGAVCICGLSFDNIKNYVDYVTVSPIPSNYVPKTNFTIYCDGSGGPSFYATAASETNLSRHFMTSTPTSYWITGNELTVFGEATFNFTNDSTGVTLKSYDANTGIAILTITDGAIIGVQLQPK